MAVCFSFVGARGRHVACSHGLVGGTRHDSFALGFETASTGVGDQVPRLPPKKSAGSGAGARRQSRSSHELRSIIASHHANGPTGVCDAGTNVGCTKKEGQRRTGWESYLHSSDPVLLCELHRALGNEQAAQRNRGHEQRATETPAQRAVMVRDKHVKEMQGRAWVVHAMAALGRCNTPWCPTGARARRAPGSLGIDFAQQIVILLVATMRVMWGFCRVGWSRLVCTHVRVRVCACVRVVRVLGRMCACVFVSRPGWEGGGGGGGGRVSKGGVHLVLLAQSMCHEGC